MVLQAKQTQRKYANARSYHCFKEGKLKGIFPLELKMTDRQLQSFLEEIAALTNADRIVLHWTVREGVVDREVQL